MAHDLEGFGIGIGQVRKPSGLNRIRTNLTGSAALHNPRFGMAAQRLSAGHGNFAESFGRMRNEATRASGKGLPHTTCSPKTAKAPASEF
jgi:hypothetical protein